MKLVLIKQPILDSLKMTAVGLLLLLFQQVQAVCPIQSPNFNILKDGNTVTLTLQGGGYNSYIVGYGDQTYGTQLTHSYTSTGLKTICVRFSYVDSINTGNSCDTTICKTVTITSMTPFGCPIQSPNFTIQQTGNTVTLTRSGTGYNSYQWDYGDGSTGASNMHTYTTPGLKQICLKAKYVDSSNTSRNCDTTVCKTVNIANFFNCPIQGIYFSVQIDGNTVRLTKYGTGYTSYQWNYGDGSTGTDSIHTYTTGGTKTICLKYTYNSTPGSCDTTYCKTITIINTGFVCPIQNPNFTALVNGNVVTLTKSGSGYTSYYWNYGDGSTGTSNIHTYATPGVKNVCLIYYYVDSSNTARHCDTSVCKPVNVPSLVPCPIRDIYFSVLISGNTVKLTKYGTGYTSYQWYYGDGIVGTDSVHTYTTAGVKTICLKYTFSTPNGTCDSTYCKTITINPVPFDCPIETPYFSVLVNGSTVSLTKVGSGYTSYLWNYGDGTTGTSNTHTYTSGGVKNICLTYYYIDSFNTGNHCDTTVCKLVTITNTTPFVCPIRNATVSAASSGLSVTLALGGTGYNAYLINYGDGSTGTATTHTYTSPGLKNICVNFRYLTSNTDSIRCDTTVCIQVYVQAPAFNCPIQNIGFTVSVNGSTVTLTKTGTGYTEYYWTYGDGNSGTSNTHTYTTTGNKTICLKYIFNTPNGRCDTTICKIVTITNLTPFVCPITTNYFGVQINGSTVTLTKYASGYTSYIWNYGDGSTGTANVHTYTTPGVKTICLTLTYIDSTNQRMCDTTYCKTITIANTTPFVCPIRNGGFTVLVSGDSVILEKQGTGYTSYIWGYGDGTYGTQNSHVYNSSGVKTICLKLIYASNSNNNTCDTVICQAVTINNACDSASCVLPGDADHDLTVNNFDIFAIGLSYGRTGPTRPNATTQYTLQPAPDWPTSNYYIFNDKFVDCNGSGLINNADASVILQNYIVKPFNTFNHRTGNLDSLPPVYLAFDSIPIYRIGIPCNTTEIVSDINVGSAAQEVNDAYGIGFSVEYPENFATDSCFSIQVDLDANSWFANNEPLLYLFKNIPEYHRVDIGISRTSGLPVNGFGRIGKIKFVVEDGIFGRGRVSGNKEYTFSVLQVGGIDNLGNHVSLTGVPTTATFVVTATKNNSVEGLKLYPNPSNDKVFITAAEPMERITVFDLAGRVLQQQDVNGYDQILDVNNWPEGMYVIEIRSANAISIVKLIRAR